MKDQRGFALIAIIIFILVIGFIFLVELKSNPEAKARKEYQQSINTIITNNAESITTVITFITTNPHKGNVERWPDSQRTVILAHMAIVKASYEAVKAEITPPKGYEEIHNKVLLALQKQSEAMGLLASALDKKSYDLIKKSVQLLEESLGLIGDVNLLLEEK